MPPVPAAIRRALQAGAMGEQRAALYNELVKLGFYLREIGMITGVSRSTVDQSLRDYGYRPVKNPRRARVCRLCGNPNLWGKKRQAYLCVDCAYDRQHPPVLWTETRIIEALQRFYTLHGRAPSSADLTPALGHNEARRAMARAAKEAAAPIPNAGTVIDAFGSMRAARIAAGLPSKTPYAVVARHENSSTHGLQLGL
jgi:hypothetical protein